MFAPEQAGEVIRKSVESDGSGGYRIKIVSAADSGGTVYTLRVDDSDPQNIYIGEALVGTSESAPSWRIQRFAKVAGVYGLTYAGGVSSFSHAWVNRAGLTYS